MPAAFEEIMSDLRKRIFKPVYFLAGEEPYYIDLITDYIEEKVLPEAEKAFNQMIIYGEETSVRSIIETSRRFPMMSNHQVVIVKEAQSLKKIEDLCFTLRSHLYQQYLSLTINTKSLIKGQSFTNCLIPGVYFESNRFRDYQVPPVD